MSMLIIFSFNVQILLFCQTGGSSKAQFFTNRNWVKSIYIMISKNFTQNSYSSLETLFFVHRIFKLYKGMECKNESYHDLYILDKNFFITIIELGSTKQMPDAFVFTGISLH